MGELIDIMMQRRSIRKYTTEDIPPDKLERIVQAGLLAPTSRNRKPCEFYIIRDRNKLKELSSAKQAGGQFLADAAAAIAVFADEDKADTWVEDSSIALAYMNLMAEEQGIGSCWIQMHLRKDADNSDAEDNCRRILGAPERSRIVGILALGIPAEHREQIALDDLDMTKVHEL